MKLKNFKSWKNILISSSTLVLLSAGFWNCKLSKPSFSNDFVKQLDITVAKNSEINLFPIIGNNGKYGYMNKFGKVIVNPQFYSAVFNDLGLYEKDDGFINKKGLESVRKFILSRIICDL